VQERFFWGEHVFEEKSSIFLQKHARPDRFSKRAQQKTARKPSYFCMKNPKFSVLENSG
jgi:hypothetical protein